MKCKLHYLTVATIPSTSAHAKYVHCLCSALNSHFATTVFGCKNQWSKKFTTGNYKLKTISVFEKGDKLRLKTFQISLFHFFYVLCRKLLFFRTRDIFFVHNALSALVCAMLKVDFVIDLHSKEFGSRFAKKIISNNQPLFWITQSILLRNYLRDNLEVPDEKILLSRNAIEKNVIQIALNHNAFKRKGFKLGYIGRLVPHMGLETLYNALSHEEQNNDKMVFLAGDNVKHGKYLSELNSKYRNSDKIFHYLGFLNSEQIEWLSNKVDAFILLYSSKFLLLGTLSPMKLFEYLRFKKYIIAPKIKDIEEVVSYYNCQAKIIYYEIDCPTSLLKAIKFAQQNASQILPETRVETWEEKANKIISFLKPNIL